MDWPMGPSLRHPGVRQWLDGKKIFRGSAQKKVRDRLHKEESGLDLRMNCKTKIVVIPMMLQTQQDTILQGVDSPEILLCPCGRTRKLTVGVGGIGERISDEC